MEDSSVMICVSPETFSVPIRPVGLFCSALMCVVMTVELSRLSE